MSNDTFKQKLVRMVRELPDEALLALVTRGFNFSASSPVPFGASVIPSGVESELPDEALLALVTKRLSAAPASQSLTASQVIPASWTSGGGGSSVADFGASEPFSGSGMTGISDETLLALVTKRISVEVSGVVP